MGRADAKIVSGDSAKKRDGIAMGSSSRKAGELYMRRSWEWQLCCVEGSSGNGRFTSNINLRFRADWLWTWGQQATTGLVKICCSNRRGYVYLMVLGRS